MGIVLLQSVCLFYFQVLTLLQVYFALHVLTTSQCAYVESDKTISEKKTTVTASMFNTYRVRNHFVPNPTNSKFIRLKKSSKNNFLLQ